MPFSLLGPLAVVVQLLPLAYEALVHGAVPDGVWTLLGAAALCGLGSELHQRLARKP